MPIDTPHRRPKAGAYGNQHMNCSDVRLMLRYNDWANARLLTAASRLAPEQYFAASDVSHGSIHNTLFHHLNSEFFWRRVMQLDPTRWRDLQPAEAPTLDALQELFAQEALLRNAYLAGLSDADMQSVVRFRFDDGPELTRLRWQIFWHVANHGTQHRAEAAMLLTRYGASPGDIDVMTYL